MRLMPLRATALVLYFGIFGFTVARAETLEEAKYHAYVPAGLNFCSRTVEYDGDYRKCITEEKGHFKAFYDKAYEKVKNPSAKLALKEHYIAALSALQGVTPLSDERKINYERRQGENQSKLDTAWIRFETEN